MGTRTNKPHLCAHCGEPTDPDRYLCEACAYLEAKYEHGGTDEDEA
jgi:predicted amidophosphoribosyltransferase